MSNEDLVIRIQAGINTEENMLQLWQQNLSFVRSMARRYKGYAEMDDLEQEGYLGLCNAVDGYDPDAGFRFITYAQRCISQRMRVAVSNNATIQIPMKEAATLWKYKKAAASFYASHGREPSGEELSCSLGISMTELHEMCRLAQLEQTDSLDRHLTDEEDSDTLGDMIPGYGNTEDAVLSSQVTIDLYKSLWHAVEQLPEDYSEVLRSRYRENKTRQQISNEMGITCVQIRGIEQKALSLLERSKSVRKLRPYLDEEIYSNAIVGTGIETFNRTWTSATERTAMIL